MTCTERKIRLSGEVVTYQCDLVALEIDYGILKYVTSERRTVASATLEPGTFTFAVYWPGRNYNLYYWTIPEDPPIDGEAGKPLRLRPVGYYFNLVDSVSLSPLQFTYRDLVVDIFVSPEGELSVLDEEELPAGTDSSLLAFIEAIKRQLLRDYRTVIAEVDSLLEPVLEGV